MDLENLLAKEELLEAQLKIVRLEKKKINFIKDQDYEKARSINDQKTDAEAYLQQLILKYRQFLNDNSLIEHADLLMVLAPLEVEYKNLILEKELLKKQDHLKEAKEIKTFGNQSNNNIEIARQKNQLLQIFIQAELLLKQWTEYHHFQKEMLSVPEYINLIRLKYQVLDLFPELTSVYCFYGSGKEINEQLKAKLGKRISIFNPIIKVLIQFGSKHSTKLPIVHEEEIINSLEQIFSGTQIFIDGKYKNVNSADKTFLYLTLKPDFSLLNIVGPF